MTPSKAIATKLHMARASLVARAFYDPIEGYSHQAGTRHVLRLKRYTRQQVPADASQYVYVLDMIVESETRR